MTVKYWVTALSMLSALGSVKSDIVRKPLNSGVAFEYGQIFNSVDFFSTPEKVDEFTMHKTIGWFTQSATVDEKFDVTVGVGAMFFYFYPHEGYVYSRVPLSAVSLTQASGTYTFGDVENPKAKLSFGLLPYKYNDNAKNLGEYLFRSTPYPSTTMNGSWEVVNSSYAKLWGLMLEKSIFDGKWKNDLLLTMSMGWPLYDLSPAYVTNFKVNSFFEIGAGVNFFHLIPNRSSITTPKNKGQFDAYFNYNGKDYYANEFYYKKISDFYTEPTLGNDPVKAQEFLATSKLVDSLNKAPIKPKYSYYTVQGPELMIHFACNFSSILGESLDFKVYGEAALLGVVNYPVFYENRMNRMPIMLGLNIPTMGLLNELGVEFEYWNNPHINSYANEIVSGWDVDAPIPDYKSELGVLHSDPSKPNTNDDLSWSIYAKKEIGKSFTGYIQIAKDHIRPIYLSDVATPLNSDIFFDKKGWYYAARIQMGI
jgi:hypothetical protein